VDLHRHADRPRIAELGHRHAGVEEERAAAAPPRSMIASNPTCFA
jgi:hypothetical protein